MSPPPQLASVGVASIIRVQVAEAAPRYDQSPAWESIAMTVIPVRRTMWNIIRGRRSTASVRREATRSGQVGVLFAGL